MTISKKKDRNFRGNGVNYIGVMMDPSILSWWLLKIHLCKPQIPSHIIIAGYERYK